MKTRFLLTITILAIASASIAQVNVKLRILHKLGSEEYAPNMAATSNDNYDIKFTRMQYYISQIKLIHDGGKEILLSDLYILENASLKQTHDLGSFSIEYLEELKFSIGVDNGTNPNPNDPSANTTNHADPSLWASSHALSNKSPAMHWGWSSGYRFVCMEGFSGSNFSKQCEMHALGDANYNEVSLLAGAENNGGEMVIEIYADYLESLAGVDMSNGFYLHSASGKAITFLDNFENNVFTPVMKPIENTTTTNELKGHNYNVAFVPNPANGPVELRFNAEAGKSYELQIFNLQGEQIEVNKIAQAGSISVSGLAVGVYSGMLLEDNRVIEIQKLIITQ